MFACFRNNLCCYMFQISQTHLDNLCRPFSNHLHENKLLQLFSLLKKTWLSSLYQVLPYNLGCLMVSLLVSCCPFLFLVDPKSSVLLFCIPFAFCVSLRARNIVRGYMFFSADLLFLLLLLLLPTLWSRDTHLSRSPETSTPIALSLHPPLPTPFRTSLTRILWTPAPLFPSPLSPASAFPTACSQDLPTDTQP